MTRTLPFAVVAACALCVPLRASAQAGAPGLTGYVTVASDYRSRGLSQADGHGVLQLGIDYRHDSGWFVGAWGANVEYAVERARADARDGEIGLYTGYDWRRGAWSLTASWSRYTYPDAWLDYDYDELAGNVSYRDRVFFSVSFSDEFYGRERRAVSQELGFAWPLVWNTELGGSLGRLHYDSAPGGGYTYWNLGATKVLRRLAIDLRFHDSSYGGNAYYGSGAVEQWVLSLTYAIQPRR